MHSFSSLPFITNDPLKPESGLIKQWCVYYTRTHHEKQIVKIFTERGLEGFVPLYQSLQVWSNKRLVKLHLPMFPNYVFARLAPHQISRARNIPGIISLVQHGKAAAHITENEIAGLRAASLSNDVKPCPDPSIGMPVRIIRGPFMGMKGTIVRNHNAAKLILTIEAIQQNISLQVDLPRFRLHGELLHLRCFPRSDVT